MMVERPKTLGATQRYHMTSGRSAMTGLWQMVVWSSAPRWEDNDALAAALNAGKLAGAGIDVFDMEPPLPAGYALGHARNCVLTPHVAFLTEEAMERRAVIEFDNVRAWLEGHPTNVCAL